jgi:hypothetical protein
MKKLLSSLLRATSLSTACFANSAAAPRPPIHEPVVQIKTDRASVRAQLAMRRAEMIKRFLAYREARAYPWNWRGTLRPAHIWFDDNGNLCAAATLISADWGRESTMKVGEKDRGIVLAKITKGELADWMLTSGLTHAEIVAIQVPPMDTGRDEMRRFDEIERLHAMYTDVERQLNALYDENLELATDRLMARPDLAFKFMRGMLPGPGKYFVEAPKPEPVPPPSTPVAPPAEPDAPASDEAPPAAS